MITSLLKDRSFRLSIIITVVFFGVGIVFLLYGWAQFSLILFGLLPIITGLAIGALPNKRGARIGTILSVILFMAFLVLYGISGLICIVMSLPFVLSLIFLGSVIVHLADRYKKIRTDKFSMLLLPLIPFLIAAPAEVKLFPTPQEIIEVRIERVYHYTPQQVYDAIKSVDTLDAVKPWLMHLDLPVPYKCILEKEEVGGLRTCYFGSGNFSNGEFGSGTITEKIIRLEKAKVLEMDVIDCEIIGRKWIGFKKAIYYFEAVNEGCKLTRVTSYTSVLTPRFYWQPMEELGIQQEHDYVLNNLEKDLEEQTGKKEF